MANKNTRLNAKEAEKIMQDAREKRMIEGENVPFSGTYEKEYIRDIVKSAKKNGRLGDKIQFVINPLYVHIPEWQREIRLVRALEIGSAYNAAKWDAPKVILYNNKLIVVDGEHRIFGAWAGKKEDMVVEFLDISLEEAIEIFLDQSKDKTRMAQADYIRAAVAIGKKEYISFRNICKQNNVRVLGDDPAFVSNPVGTWTNLQDGLELAAKNPDLLDRILKLIGELKWNGNTNKGGGAYGAKVTRALQRLYTYFNGREDVLESVLIENCKGAKYFDENLRGIWDNAVFDFLIKIIERETNEQIEYEKVGRYKRLKMVK